MKNAFVIVFCMITYLLLDIIAVPVNTNDSQSAVETKLSSDKQSNIEYKDKVESKLSGITSTSTIPTTSISQTISTKNLLNLHNQNAVTNVVEKKPFSDTTLPQLNGRIVQELQSNIDSNINQNIERNLPEENDPSVNNDVENKEEVETDVSINVDKESNNESEKEIKDSDFNNEDNGKVDNEKKSTQSFKLKENNEATPKLSFDNVENNEATQKLPFDNVENNNPKSKSVKIFPITTVKFGDSDVYPNSQNKEGGRDEIGSYNEVSNNLDGGDSVPMVPQLTANGEFKDDGTSHFFAYFITLMIMAVIAYLVLHNKKRIIALIIEGRDSRNGKGRRGGNTRYHKLDNNLEEAMSNMSKNNSYSQIY